MTPSLAYSADHPGASGGPVIGWLRGMGGRGRTAELQSEHAGRFGAIFGRVSFSRVGGEVAGVKRTGHRSATNFYRSFKASGGLSSFSRVKFCQEPARGLSKCLGASLCVVVHGDNQTRDRIPDGGKPTAQHVKSTARGGNVPS